MDYEIKDFKGHYVVVDENGKIVCHCDTYEEAEQEIYDLESNN